MMKKLNIGIAVIAIFLTLASCGNSTEQNSSEAERNQSATYTSAISSEQSASSEQTEISGQTSSEIPISSAITENNTTSKAVTKAESGTISSKTNATSRTSSMTNLSSRIAVSSSPTSGKITAADSEWIANRVLELINAERTKLGHGILSTAPKAHEIATVRAKELTTKFSHDRPDGRVSGTVYNDFKYGECMNYSAIIPKEEWSDYENLDSEGKSYGPGGSENITEGVEYIQNNEVFDGVTYSCGDKEMYARKITRNFQNSSAHWSDITKAEYTGVGIGVVLTIQGNAVKYDCCILTMDRTYG